MRPEHQIEFVTFAPNNGWYIKWKNGEHAWDNLPPTLHNKLSGRPPSLPAVSFLAISEDELWFVRFQDGSSCWSQGVCAYSQKMWAAVKDGEGIESVIFAPGGGWFLQFEEHGECIWERLPSTLVAEFEKRGIVDIMANPERAALIRKRKIRDEQKKQQDREQYLAANGGGSGSLSKRSSMASLKEEALAATVPGSEDERRLSTGSQDGGVPSASNSPPVSPSLLGVSVEQLLDASSGSKKNKRRSFMIGRKHVMPSESEYISVERLAINGQGGWWVLFDNGESAFDSLPSNLEKLLSRRNMGVDVMLSPSPGSQDFLAAFENGSVHFVHPDRGFRRALRGGPGTDFRNEKKDGDSDSGYCDSVSEITSFTNLTSISTGGTMMLGADHIVPETGANARPSRLATNITTSADLLSSSPVEESSKQLLPGEHDDDSG
ncbi:hypothetical protein HK102_010535, partial [Quaeritorhiza haematococci]